MMRYNSLSMRSVTVLAGVAIAFSSGCASQRVQSLHADPTLHFQDVQEGKVALLPVAARADEVPLDELAQLDAALHIAFDRNAHGLQRVPQDAVTHAIKDDPANRDTLLRVSDTGKADVRALVRLGKAVGARYLLFTIADYKELRDPSIEHQAWVATQVSPSDWEHGPRKRAADVLRVQSPSTSELTVTAVLLDIDARRVRWEATHSVSRSVGNTIHNPRPSRISWEVFSQIAAALPRPD